MTRIFKYKKTIISILIVLLVVSCGLGLLGYNSRVIKIDNDNDEFCYSLEKLGNSDNPLNYPNAYRINKYQGTFNKLTIKYISSIFEVDNNFLQDNTSIGIVGINNVVKLGLEVIVIANTVSRGIKNFMPDIAIINENGVVIINIIPKPTKLVTDQDIANQIINMKLLIKIL